ncbi:MAG: LysE family translocator [Clostridia bacterium]|nr:LysE family translocator [Clostridia bacterium]
MFGIIGYGSFVLSSIMLNLTPGSDTIYVLTRAAIGGRRKGIISALGISTGILIHTVLVALGLSVILEKSVLAFNIVKLAGAGYLIFLGVKAIVSKKSLFSSDDAEHDASTLAVYRQGVLTNVLNPKTALFFLALLPQFVSADNAYGALPFLLLGLTFFTTSTIWSVFLAFIASYANRFLLKNEKVHSIAGKITGVIYILLGVNVLRAKIGA